MGRIVVLSIVLILLLIKKSISAPIKGDSISGLIVSGKPAFDGRGKDRVYKVELIRNNIVIDSLEVKDRRSFEFKLSKNEYYGIRISKKGFISKLVSIDTEVSEEKLNKEHHHFYFETKLLNEDKLDKLNKDALDFPVAVISFNERQESFSYNKKYAAEIKRRMYFKNIDWS